MPAWRCPACLINWPEGKLYDDCPKCGTDTEPLGNIKPDWPKAEAASIAKHFLFDRFYERWDATKPDERLQPTADDDVRFPFQPELGDRRPYAERHPIPVKTKKSKLWDSKLLT